MEAGEFAKGSMLPKVDACVSFIEHTRGDKKAIISSLKKAVEALSGKSGTTIIRRKDNGN
jgi:carbamate kinase